MLDQNPVPPGTAQLDVVDVRELNRPEGRPQEGVMAARPAGPRVCACVRSHTPVVLDDEPEGHHIHPMGWGGPDRRDNMVWLCATTHTSVHNLLDEYVSHGGTPPWEQLKRFRPYVRRMAADGWARSHPDQGGTP